MTDRVPGVPMVFCTNAAIASDGTVWFSDSPTQFGIDKWRHDFLQNTRTGRLLLLGETGEVEVVLDGLAFANGVALALDESYVAVAESGARTVVRWWLTGPRAGEHDGRVWLGSLHEPAVAVVDLWAIAARGNGSAPVTRRTGKDRRSSRCEIGLGTRRSATTSPANACGSCERPGC